MKITVLTDNVAGSVFLAEHGLSFLIETKGRKLLLDTGNSDVYINNANKLGIDIQNEIETIVLSHGHWDHGNGLKFLKNKLLITHPGAFIKRYRKNQLDNIGLDLTKDELEKRYKLILSSNPYRIYDNVYFLGGIPRENDFESQTTTFEDENRLPDFVIDDSAIAVVEDDYLSVVTGCSHSGICNIVSHAMKITGVSKIKTVMGGFHLKKDNSQTQKTIDFLKKIGVENLYPSHCTEFEALTAFSKEFEIVQIKTGMEIKV